MKITSKNKSIFFFPECEEDIFNIGKLSMKFDKTKTEFIKTTDDRNAELKLMEVDKKILLLYLNK